MARAPTPPLLDPGAPENVRRALFQRYALSEQTLGGWSVLVRADGTYLDPNAFFSQYPETRLLHDRLERRGYLLWPIVAGFTVEVERPFAHKELAE